MKFTNRQFGELEVEEQHVLHFPEGIIGFEECRKFLIVHDEDSEPFRWLVSLEDAALSFPLLDPTLLIPDYNKGLGSKEEANIFVIATLNEKVEESTLNLRSPIVVDETRTGRQIVLDDESLQLQFPLIPTAFVEERG
ncbi:MAG: flagellar assembly protein FliW [Ignavibacteriales bacterium]|nr:flagellar assembly protein FliW [Ignavibacteriales bacterium]MBI3787411.1 flagellar assembly protein FliW [Ignavibacteriales bacterium]